MRSGQCPKCNSKTVYSRSGGVYFYHSDLFVQTSFLNTEVSFDSFVCTTCGYFENYITEQEKLADVAGKWQQVPPLNP